MKNLLASLPRGLDAALGRRVLLITGKGGVGRSSVTAALATAAARRGKRVVLTELGGLGAPESALARIFGLEKLPDVKLEISPGIQSTLLLPHVGQEQFLRSV